MKRDREREGGKSPTQIKKNYFENQKNLTKDGLLTQADFSISLHNSLEN